MPVKILPNEVKEIGLNIQIPEEHKTKIQNAYSAFKAKADSKTHDDLMALIHQAHNELHQMLQAIRSGEPLPASPVEIPELCFALTALDAAAERHEFPEDFSYISADGNIWGFGKYENLDYHWVEAVTEHLLHIFTRTPFTNNPVHTTIGDNVSLGIIGDWGTGYWQGADTPAAKIAAQFPGLNLDHTFHLGDVYYTGTKHNEINNLVELWPRGRSSSFALNSNHEMYPKGLGYFERALERLFTYQNGCSYFVLENTNWMIIGLDSAYQATKFYSKGNLSSSQITWLEGLASSIGSKKVLVLSHHLGLELAGTPTPLFHQVTNALNRTPDVWYWGHAHNAAVYKPQNGFLGRCCGHGAIPYGNATILQNSDAVEWYESTPADQPNPNNRVKNGFAVVRLNGPHITEQFIDEDSHSPWPHC